MKQNKIFKVGRYGRYLETLLEDGKKRRGPVYLKMKKEIDIDKSIKYYLFQEILVARV